MRREFHLYVADGLEEREPRTVLRETAERYLKRGSKQVDKHTITDPDWHTPSWLVLEELERVRESLESRSEDLDAVIAMMRELERSGRKRARLVFWFDN